MSDNELDDELLALAGGDNESGDEAKQEQSLSAPTSPPPASSPLQATPSRSRSPPRHSLSSKKSAKTSKSAPRKRRKGESEDEGEVSSAMSEPESLGRNATSKSESDKESTKDGDGENEYPLEGKYKDAKDRAEILALPEIQREEILAERAARIDDANQRLQLRRLLQQRERSEAKAADKKKRKAGSADLDDDSVRKSSRQKTKTSDKLEAYKRQRQQAGEERKRREDRKGQMQTPVKEDAGSSPDASGESVEWDDSQTAIPSVREEEPAELRDFERARAGRTNFAKVCFTPGFEDKIPGCFARVNIGVDRSTGQNIYRMAKISRIVTGRPYAMEGPNGKHFITDQYVLLAHGKAEREWPFLTCSDSKFTEAEFEQYKRTMQADNLPLPSKSYLVAKLGPINDLINHRWTAQEIEQKLKRSGVLQVKNAAFIRESLLSERKLAVAREDEAAVSRIDREMAALEGPKLAFGTSMNGHNNSSKSTNSPSQQDRLAALNKANRIADAERIRKAQIAEKRAQEKARAEAAARRRKRAEEEAAMKKDAEDQKPQLVDSKPQVVDQKSQLVDQKPQLDDEKAHLVDQKPQLTIPSTDDLFGEVSDLSRAVTPLSGGLGTPKRKPISRTGTPPNGARENGTKEKKGGIPTFRKKNLEDDILANVDLGIDIEI